jgi:hypothetical protein
MDLDKIHEERIGFLSRKVKETGELDLGELYTSTKVIEQIYTDKVFIESFDLDRLLAILPFTPAVYVYTCPLCITKKKFKPFSRLIDSGLIVPVMAAPYSEYDTNFVDNVVKYDHISFHEFQYSRYVSALSSKGQVLCGHCMGEMRSELANRVKRRQHAARYRTLIDSVFRWTHPAVDSDSILFELLQEAIAGKDIDMATQLSSLAGTLHTIRSAEAINASIIIDDQDIDLIPEEFATNIDNAKDISTTLKMKLADGLGLKIPADMPIDQYIELVKDLQTQVSDVLNTELMNANNSDVTIFSKNIFSRIAEINREVERLKRSKRYVLLEVTSALVRKNKAVTASVLLAGTLGIATGLWGCGGAAAAGISTKLGAKAIKKAGLIKNNVPILSEVPAVSKLAKLVQTDLQPRLDTLVSRYAGVERAAVRVLSLRKHIEDRTGLRSIGHS